MLPIVLYNNMEAGTSNHNSSFGQLYDDNVILNCVRTRKKVSDLPNCPVCSCTIRQGELETHLGLEVERLHKISCSSGKRKLSSSISSNLAVPGSSTSTDLPDDQEVDVSGCPGSEIYQRVHDNRMRRLRARRRSPPPPQNGECPLCNVTLPVSRLQRHALRCLKRSGASVDADLPDTSEEEGSIDVENDEPEPESGFGAEYQWCGEWRVRATALQSSDARVATCVRRASNDHALVVDGDEDTELYGPPQYSPSRIALDAEITPSEDLQADQDQHMPEENRREDVAQNGTEGVSDAPVQCPRKMNGLVEASAEEFEHFVSHNYPEETRPEEKRRLDAAQNGIENRRNMLEGSSSKVTGLVEASAETRIQALKAKINELQMKHNGESETKCLICLAPYASPAVSIQCWHVYCEVCWLQSLRAKKICPQCSAITTAAHLRRIYM